MIQPANRKELKINTVRVRVKQEGEINERFESGEITVDGLSPKRSSGSAAATLAAAAPADELAAAQPAAIEPAATEPAAAEPSAAATVGAFTADSCAKFGHAAQYGRPFLLQAAQRPELLFGLPRFFLGGAIISSPVEHARQEKVFDSGSGHGLSGAVSGAVRRHVTKTKERLVNILKRCAFMPRGTAKGGSVAQAAVYSSRVACWRASPV